MQVPWWATFNIELTGYPDPDNPDQWIGGLRPAGE
jgi:hypothetical protein